MLHEKQTHFLTKVIIFPLISNETTSSIYNKNTATLFSYVVLLEPRLQTENTVEREREGEGDNPGVPNERCKLVRCFATRSSQEKKQQRFLKVSLRQLAA
jgi:hypothetical protein